MRKLIVCQLKSWAQEVKCGWPLGRDLHFKWAQFGLRGPHGPQESDSDDDSALT
jgi:hypothetical protein